MSSIQEVLFSVARLLLFLIPQSFSLLGSSIAQFGIIWTLTLSYSSGKILLLASIAAFIPQIALMVLSGVLSDKRKRKRVIILSDLFSALIALFFSLSIREGISLYLCLFVLAARSAASGLQTPAVESAIPLIAGSDNLKRANGMKGLLSSVVMLLSPVLAGILLPSFGLSGLMVLDAVTALLAIVMLLPFSVPENQKRENAMLREGYTYVIREKRILRLLVFHFIALFLISPGAALTPLLVSVSFSPSSSLLSISESTYSIGMILGGLFISFSRRQPSSLAILLSIYALMLLGMSFCPLFALYAVMNGVIGFVSPQYTALMNSEIQGLTEEAKMGRVMSILSIGSVSAVPLGLLVMAPLADTFSVNVIFAVAGILILIHAIVFAIRSQL